MRGQAEGILVKLKIKKGGGGGGCNQSKGCYMYKQ